MIVKGQARDNGDLRKYRIELPVFIFDMDLEPYEFRLYVHLKRRTDNDMGQATTRELAKQCNMSIGATVNSRIKLQEKGLLKIRPGMTPEMARAACEDKKPQYFTETQPGVNSLLRTCKWCRCTTVAIQEHHYPIPKSEGGTETVSICANCHAEFHKLVSESYRLVATERIRNKP